MANDDDDADNEKLPVINGQLSARLGINDERVGAKLGFTSQ